MSDKRPPAAATVTLTAEDDAALRAATRHLRLPSRYLDLGVIGEGGMGEVRRVFDQVLRRTLAMKLIRMSRAQNRRSRLRFLREAQITAGLSHPGIVAVHDQGTLGDGRVWYTMQLIEGQTLADILPETPQRRLVAILVQVARAVGSAHRQGIVHRDLKPSNLMIGEFGEVLVLDWGIAIKVGEATEAERVGTPAYMPPEQATGKALAPQSDVFALGAMLHEILTGRPPLNGITVGHTPLEQTCRRALASEPADRFPDALPFADALQAWLDGAERRAAAEQIFQQADGLLEPIRLALAEADRLGRKADAILAPLPPHAPVSQKQPGWRLAEQAKAKAREARLLEVELVQKARAALEQDETYREPRGLLADLYRRRVIAAEARRDEDAAAENMALLRAQDDGRYAEWIAGEGRITLHVDAPGARFRMRRIEERERRLVPTEVVHEGAAPWIGVPASRGSYQIEVEAPGRASIVVPVHLDRGQMWSAGPPQDRHRPIHVPEDLASDDAYVPAGWFIAGGDRLAVDTLERRRLWLDGFIIQRHPVTNARYLKFLNDLVAQGFDEQALACQPWYPRGVTADEVAVYARDAGGAFVAQPGEMGEEWLPDHPVGCVDWWSAMAYARWVSARTGQRWRLPHAFEREKAARGVDGREFPWGSFFEPQWTRALKSCAGRPRRASVHVLVEDSSPYGVMGLAGNMRDWCANRYLRTAPPPESVVDCAMAPDASDEFRAVRGGSFSSEPVYCRSAARFGIRPQQRRATVGFRLARAVARPETV